MLVVSEGDGILMNERSVYMSFCRRITSLCDQCTPRYCRCNLLSIPRCCVTSRASRCRAPDVLLLLLLLLLLAPFRRERGGGLTLVLGGEVL